MRGRKVVEGLLIDMKTAAKELGMFIGHHYEAIMYGNKMGGGCR